jgi:predicted component of type VI protein secretion system
VKHPVLIGRHQECDVQIPSRKISRRHCCLAQVNNHLVVRDLGSTNGIRINGVKTIEGNLEAGDELMIGNMRYQFKYGAAPGQDGQDHHAVRAVKPMHAKRSDNEESRDDPMPLPDMTLDKPAPQGKPAVPRQLPLEVPDQIELVPLDPPPS